MRKLITKRKLRFYNRKLETGFSMLEAVVTVGVLLALAVAGFFAYGAITENARKAVVKTDASKLHTAALVANTDSESDTSTQGVLDEYNESTTVTQAAFLDASKNVIEGTFNPTLDQDFCVKVYYVEDPETFSINGNCTDPVPTDPGGGDGGGTQPIYAKSFECGGQTFGLTAAQIAGTDKGNGSWDSYVWDDTQLYYNTFPIIELTFKNSAGQLSNKSNYPARIQLVDASSAGSELCYIEYQRDGVYSRSDGPAYQYLQNKELQNESWYANGTTGLLHRDGGPAQTTMRSGIKTSEKWYFNGQLHNPSGFAWTERANDGKMIRERGYNNGVLFRTFSYSGGNPLTDIWVNAAGQKHRLDGPASTTYNTSDPSVKTSELWYKNDVQHRLDGPALINRLNDGTTWQEVWYKDGVMHRDLADGPAQWYTNSGNRYERYWVDGAQVRTIDTTATGKVEKWYKDLKLHRVDGPAIQSWDSTGKKLNESYYLDGVYQSGGNCSDGFSCSFTG